ncbi:MAG: tetratricopeptide repeat protein [Polyangia bacterium]|jgi:tetratricopeptide (TPR) repeat protein
MTIGAILVAAQLGTIGCAGTSNKAGAQNADDEDTARPPGSAGSSGQQQQQGMSAAEQQAMQAKARAAAEQAKKVAAHERADFDATVERWDALKKAGPLSPADCHSLASKFESIAGSHPAVSAQSYFNAGTLLEQCASDKDAEQDYNRALQANGAYSPALNNLGEIYYRRGNTPQARESFEKAIAADPTHDAPAYNNLALILYQDAVAQKNPAGLDDAIGKLRRALAIDNDSMPAYQLLALIYYTKAEHDKTKLALADLVVKQAKETDDKYAPIYNTDGLIKLRKKNVTGALKEFEKAVELNPRYVEAYLNIGAIGLSARQYEKAQHAFETVLKLQPSSIDATIGLGVALRGEKQFDQAETYYKKAAQLEPKNCAVPYDLGLLYQDYKVVADNSNLKEAQNYFRQYLSCGTTSPKKVEDANRRIKDIDDTFAAIAQQKQMEAQMKAMEAQQKQQQEEMQKQQEEQKKAAPAAPDQKGGPAAPAAGAAAPKAAK